MASVPDFLLSTVIPEPSAEAVRDFLPLAFLTWGDDVLAYYMWPEYRKVIVWTERHNLWFLQDDMRIRDSISDVLGCAAGTLELWNFMLFDGPAYRHGVQMPDKLAELFLDCEWSDYACDRRPVSARISIRFGDLHTVAAAPVQNRNDASVSDDDAPPKQLRRLL